MVKLIKDLAAHPGVKQLGPGLVTGAADDDPSGIATYSQAGAQFGFNMLWTVVFTYPLMVGIQTISARIGRGSGKGLAANIRTLYPKQLLYAIVLLLVVANTIKIAADIAAMGDALQLLVGGPQPGHAMIFAHFALIMQVYVPYQRHVHLLLWLTLALLAYVSVPFTVYVNCADALGHAIFPQMPATPEVTVTIVAVFGT